MEKKQKTAIKRLQFVIVIALGSNCPGVTIWGQYNIVLGWNCPGELSRGNCPRWELSGGTFALGPIVRGSIFRGGGNFPGKNYHRTFMKSNRFFVGLS